MSESWTASGIDGLELANARRSSGDAEISLTAALLLSVFSVGLAVVGLLALVLSVASVWLLAALIPVPPFVPRLLSHLGLM